MDARSKFLEKGPLIYSLLVKIRKNVPQAFFLKSGSPKFYSQDGSFFKSFAK
jgi:hypothetical protein